MARALLRTIPEPAFALEELTFGLWNVGAGWQEGPVKPPRGEGADADGAKALLSCVTKDLRRWAEAHWDAPLDREAIGVLERHEDVDAKTIHALNPDFDEAELEDEAAALGWVVDVEGAVRLRDAKSAAAKITAPKKPATKRSAPEKPATKPSAAKKSAPTADAGTRKPSFGQAEFTVRCQPTYVALVVHGKEVRKLEEDVYGELFDYVRARLSKKKR